MDRSNVRVAVFSAGIVSGLLLLLYLPVLIWSPPWGENGYYIEGFWIQNAIKTPIDRGNPDYPSYCSFDDGYLKSHFGLLIGDIHRVMRFNVKYTKGNNDTWSFLDPNKETQNIIIRDGIIEKHPDSYDTTAQLIKVNNPLFIWYIKWLEWSGQELEYILNEE